MSSKESHVLLSVEAEAYVDHLRKYELKDVGSRDWSRQREMIEKLNMQAVLNASAQEDEYIKDFLISSDKVKLLIYDLVVTEVWKEKIFKELIEMDFKPKTTFPIYMVLYHEASVVNLLETTMFFKETCENAEENVIDLVDYCYRKLTNMISLIEEEEFEEDENELATESENMDELQKQDKKIQFEICVKIVSLLRYILDNLETLPISVVSRLLNTLDIPILFVQLVENPPWKKRKGNKVLKYVDTKWQELSYGDSMKLSKTEGQVWLALYHLLMNPVCQQKYELNSYRKNVILKLRSYLTEVTLDQLPILVDMQRYLENLSMMDAPPVKKDLILEQVPEIHESIVKAYEGRWEQIAKKQAKKFFSLSDTELRAQAKRWADTYNFDMLEDLIAEPPKCAVCGADATKRCSRCQSEWYCRRECQVNHWSKHKTACNLMVSTQKETIK